MSEPQRPYTKPEPVFLDTYPHPDSAEHADQLIELFTANLAKLDDQIIAAHAKGTEEDHAYGDQLRVERRRVAEQLRNIAMHKAIAFK